MNGFRFSKLYSIAIGKISFCSRTLPKNKSNYKVNKREIKMSYPLNIKYTFTTKESLMGEIWLSDIKG